MIRGFEEYTHELSQEERDALDYVVKMLKKRVGDGSAVTNEAISKYISHVSSMKIGGARIRKIINHIRRNGLVQRLVSTSKGYYISENVSEIRDYIESLESRISAIAAVRDSMKDQMKSYEKELEEREQGRMF